MSEKHRYKLKDSPLKGSHSFRRGRKKVIHTRPGEIVEALPEEIGKKHLSRFEDLGVVEENRVSRRTKAA